MPNTPQISADLVAVSPIAEVAGFVDVAMAENAGVFAHTHERKEAPARASDRGFQGA
jgi:hypothetical protein